MLVAVLLPAVVVSGCGRAGDRSVERVDTLEPVETLAARPTTTAPPVTAPPVTKPLTTAPPSPLLDEVVAAYDAAYDDLLAAEATMDPDSPVLDDHMAGAQLEKVREAIRGFAAAGQRIRHVVGGWRRVETMRPVAEASIDLEVCRRDRDQTIGKDGTVLGADNRAFRYLEAFDRIEGEWRWTGRTWLDDAPFSDCASL